MVSAIIELLVLCQFRADAIEFFLDVFERLVHIAAVQVGLLHDLPGGTNGGTSEFVIEQRFDVVEIGYEWPKLVPGIKHCSQDLSIGLEGFS